MEESASFVNHGEKTASGVIIVSMRLEVVCNILNSLGEKGYLDFGGSSIAFMGFEFVNDLLFRSFGHS